MEEKDDFQDFRRKKPAAQANRNVPVQAQQPYRSDSGYQSREAPAHQRERTVDPRAVNRQPTNGIRSDAREVNARNGQVSRSKQGAHIQPAKTAGRGRNAKKVQPRKADMKKTARSRKTIPEKQQKPREWIYPEGYSLPQQRRPQNGVRSPQGNKRSAVGNNRSPRKVQKKKSPPRSRIDWQRVGVIAGAAALRFVCCALVFLLILGLLYRNMFYSETEPEAKKVTYSFAAVSGESDEAKTTVTELTFDSAMAYSGDELLISFSEISKWLGTAQVGDIYSMRFVIGSENVVFHNSSQNAFVNGAPIVMKCCARFRNGEVWVPLSFVQDYITGIEIVQSEGNISLALNGEELSFVLSSADPLAPVAQPEQE